MHLSTFASDSTMGLVKQIFKSIFLSEPCYTKPLLTCHGGLIFLKKYGFESQQVTIETHSGRKR